MSKNSKKEVYRDSSGRFAKLNKYEGVYDCEPKKITSKEGLLSSKKTIYQDENGMIRKVITEPCYIRPPCRQNDLKKEITGETKKYLTDLSIAAHVEEYKIFHESLLNNLEKGVLVDKISNLRKSIIEITNDNPFYKYGKTKEFKKAKSEFFYEIIYQVMGLRKKIFNDIKEKYGENAADAILYIMRDYIKDIWYNRSDSDIELSEKEKDLNNEESSLVKIEERNENELSSLPKINGDIINCGRTSMDSEIIGQGRSDVIELDICGDDLTRDSNILNSDATVGDIQLGNDQKRDVDNLFMTDKDYFNMLSKFGTGKTKKIVSKFDTRKIVKRV